MSPVTTSLKLPEVSTLSSNSGSSWDPLKTPCPYNQSWCPAGKSQLKKKRILVDLGHAERVTIDSAVSPNLDRSSNKRLFNWQDWADDMRSQGYTVSVLTKKPLSPKDLVSCDLFIVAQPDMGKSGPVYFTQAEKDAISCFILRGNTLLVMAQQFMGGTDQDSYAGDMATSYASARVINDLLDGLHVSGRFTEGQQSAGILDIMASDDLKSQVYAGSMPDIRLPSDGLGTGMKPGTFAGFHVLSIVPSSVTPLVRADQTTFTSPKNLLCSPVIQAEGSRPVAIGYNGLGCGKVYLYGDPSAWQGRSFFGSVYTTTNYHEQDAARVLIARMMSYNQTCQPCSQSGGSSSGSQTTGGAPKVQVTPSGGDCTSCIDNCVRTRQDRDLCISEQCQTSGPRDYGGVLCNDCVQKALVGNHINSALYAQCMKDNACSCPEEAPAESCSSCIDTCTSKYHDTYSREHCIMHECKVSGFQAVTDPGDTGANYCKYCRDKNPGTWAGYAQCIKDNNCNCPETQLNDCMSCLTTCKTGDVTCVKKCEAEYGPTGKCDCKTCQEKCMSDASCLDSCAGTDGRSVCDLGKGDCKSCIKDCRSGDTGCIELCQKIYSDSCDCQTCITQCGTNNDCKSFCKGADRSDCSTGTQGDTGCVSCITACNNKKDSFGQDLSDVALKQCYEGCGSGFCDSAWNKCNTITIAEPGSDVPNPHPGGTALSPSSCYLKSMTDSRCQCVHIPTLCRTLCSDGQTPVIQPDGTTRCVAGTLDAAACGKECSSTMSGTIDSCGNCLCTLPEQMDCTCPTGQTAATVNGACTCQSAYLSGGVTISIPKSGCLDCYKKCSTSSATKKTSSVSTGKSGEVVLNTCQKTCDKKYNTNIASCACSGTTCDEGQTPTLTAGLSCTCVESLMTGLSTEPSGLPDMSSQWSEHYEGSQTSPAQNCHQECLDPCHGNECCAWKTVCT